MKKHFVKTENYARFLAAVRAVEERGAAEAGMLLVHGRPGYGKSSTVERWALETGAVFLRAKVDWTPRYCLRELAQALPGVDATGTSQALFRRVVDHVVRTRLAIVVDEAEFCLADGAKVLEKLRDISDYAETMVVLIGMERLPRLIARHGQIHSRIAAAVEFGPATLADVRYACQALSEVPISDALAAEVHRISGGRMRETLNIISRIERMARASGLETADVADFAGQALAVDWASGQAQTVGGRP